MHVLLFIACNCVSEVTQNEVAIFTMFGVIIIVTDLNCTINSKVDLTYYMNLSCTRHIIYL